MNRKILAACVILITIFSSQTFIFAQEEMRGLWVTTAYNLDWPSRRGLSNDEIKREADIIIARAASQGINAIFLQVRPAADAFYRSEIFPWSHLLTGEQGVAPANDFDPLGYWIEQAHANGIELHAWLNPYRITFPNQNITNPNLLSENHPARKNPELVIAHEAALFFDPGNPAARQLIFDGVKELLKYNLDGIHLDDYFYPSRAFADSATFTRYGAGMDLHDWRRENVNALVRGLQTLVRETNPRVRFGISPTAIWKNNTTDERGSATRGNESYHALYADTRRWVEEGWLDYIAPQIYWYTGFEIACYEVVLSWWEGVVRGTNVDLYVGHSVYREVENRANWNGELLRQLERNARSDVVRGSIFFRAHHMNSNVGEAIGAFFASREKAPAPQSDKPAVTMNSLTVVQPRVNSTAPHDATGFYFFGAGVPNVPIFANGQLVENRTEEGFFSVFLPIGSGENSFTFTQEGQTSVTRIVTRPAPPQPPPPETMAQAGVTNAFPAANEYARAGMTLTLSATAPAGATVTAEIGGQTVRLSQANNANLTATANRIYAARFTGSFTLNAAAPADTITDIGRPVYTMTWNGQTRTATSAGMIRQIGIDAQFFAEISADNTWVFPNATTTGGSHWLLQRGQIDRVAAISGNWTRLASGGWVENTNVRTFRDANILPQTAVNSPLARIGYFSEGLYIPGKFEDTIVWEVPFSPAVFAEFDGTNLIFALGMQSFATPIFVNMPDTIFSKIEIGIHNGAPAYFMTLREGENLEGFYTEYSDGQLQLILRKRKNLVRGNYPFAGFTFVIDAGHGGNDSGAVGPMGAAMSESMLVLTHAQMLRDRLENLGAEVVMVRDSADKRFELVDRVAANYAVKPDMFISLHTNATAETTNATNIHGFSVWYRNENSRPAAATFMSSMRYVNPLTNRNNAPSQSNFFVCRPSWSPAILLEASFTNNIRDFSWLINERAQIDYAWGIVNALLRYYRA
jgi:uncharacterized lipoprotein YddW (UPF0748 family)/N-acetylmuramoyl-L-alanine amidase